MRVSTHAITNSGPVAPAGSGPKASSDVDGAFAALLAAAVPQAEALVAEPLPLTTAAPSAQDSIDAESLLPGAEQAISSIIDPSLLALIPDTRTLATSANPGSTDAAESVPVDPATTIGAKALPPVQAGMREPLATSAADQPAHREKTDTTTSAAASLPDAQAASTPRTPIESPESPSSAMPHTSVVGTGITGGIAVTGPDGLHASAAEVAKPAAMAHIAMPVASDRWGHALNERVLWMAQKEVQSASLTLNPPELGPVTVELQLNDTQAMASFSSSHPEARKAIEDALPTLKILFAEAGLDLHRADVGSGNDQSRYRHQQQPGDPSTASDAKSSAPGNADATMAVRAARPSQRLLDTFA